MTHAPERFFANAPTCQKCSHGAGKFGVCPLDSKPIHLHADTGYCPADKLLVRGEKPDGWETIEDAKPVPPVTQDSHYWGPPLWREFHRAPFESALLDREGDWLLSFAERIPCGECRDGFLQLLKQNPPDLSSREAYFSWGIGIHNAVNRKLGKAEMTVEDARKAQGC